MSKSINMQKKIKRAEELNAKNKKKMVFGNLTIIEFLPVRPESETRYDCFKNMPWCRCLCKSPEHAVPVECIYPYYVLANGIVSSCGCLGYANYKKMKQEQTLRLTYKGESLTVPEWSEKIGVSISGIRHRMKAGKPIHEVLKPRERSIYDTDTQIEH